MKITLDSRKIKPGTIFVAAKGATPGSLDGHTYIQQAIENGASKIILDEEKHLKSFPSPLAGEGRRDVIPTGRGGRDGWIPPAAWPGPRSAPGKTEYSIEFKLVPNARVAIANLAEELAGYPSKQLKVFGITGTNGKSTVAHLAAEIVTYASPSPRPHSMRSPLSHGGRGENTTAAVIGTLGYGDPHNLKPTTHTTPEAEDLSNLLCQFVEDGVNYVFMEVSSHAIATHRIDGIHFEGVALTTLGRDHLDFHPTLEAYHKTKTDWLALHPSAPIDDVQIANVVEQNGRTSFTLAIQSQYFDTHTLLIGKHNLENIQTAISLTLMTGLDPSRIAKSIPHLTAPKGRMELVHSYPNTYIDYAHTPDALKAALTSLRPHTSGKLIVVFGCGGDRDKEKRPLMGNIASKLADVVIVTDDNPRTEEAEGIRKDILSFRNPASLAHAGVQNISDGFPPQPGPDPDPVRERPHRQSAISHAIDIATPSDVILIAGKGHEDYQIIGTTKYPFDDAEVARACFNQN